MTHEKNIIALDMEWNQPLPWKEYPQVPKALMPGEIIQIGAVKLSPAGEELSRLQLHIRPKYFKQVHWKVKKLTQISQSEMMTGVTFPEAAQTLGSWLREDGAPYDIFAWGGEDERVLVANLETWGMAPGWLPEDIYDMRLIYDSFRGRYQQSTSLTDAAAELGVRLELTQHDSLNDALYLAAICRLTDLSRGIADYEELDGSFHPGAPLFRQRRYGFRTLESALTDQALTSFSCPACGKALRCREWVPQNKNKQLGLVTCSCGSGSFLRLRCNPRPDGTLSAVFSVYPTGDEAESFYRKRYAKWQNALKYAKKKKN